jgi:hypothetical protein
MENYYENGSLECPKLNKIYKKIETLDKKIDEEALPIINADAVLTSVVLLIIVEQSRDGYSAIDES